MRLDDIFPESVRRHLDDVEKRLLQQARSRDPDLDAWSQEPVAAGGKRVRPLLVLTAFQACGGDAGDDRAIDAAVAVELIHTASLVHDDIMDRADTRRGLPSSYAAHGLDGALLVGDYLFTQAFALAARFPPRVLDLITDACRRLCEGQLAESRLERSKNPDRDAYRAVIRDKTAALLAAGTAIGAALAGSDDERVEALYRYGNSIGYAFQVLDDVLDVAGDPQWTGKPAGTDYVAGTLSSPYLAYLERGGSLPSDRRREDFPKVRDQLFATGAVAQAQQEAATYTQAALVEVQDLPAGAARDALTGLAEFLMERVG